MYYPATFGESSSFERDIYVSVLDKNIFSSKSDAYEALINKCHSLNISGGSIVTLKKIKENKYLVLKIEGKTVYGNKKRR